MTDTMGLDSLRGRAGLVTGAASGIGRETALAFVRAGAKVMVADIDERGGAETVELAGADNAAFVKTDVTDPDQAKAMVDAVLGQFGRLDFAHNNAGVELSGPMVDEVPQDEWRRILDINLGGVWNCLRAELTPMLEQGKGSIVNTASGLGLVAIPGHSPYISAKSGVIGLTRAAAIDYGRRGIRVNVVCPGGILTPFWEEVSAAEPELLAATEAANPMGRLGRPSEIAQAVLWLCSDASSYVNGHPLVIDGGHLASG